MLTAMRDITLFSLDKAAATLLASDPSAFAERYEMALAPHESIAVAILLSLIRIYQQEYRPEGPARTPDPTAAEGTKGS